MPNPAATTPYAPASQAFGDNDKDQSPGDYSSAVESENEAGEPNGSGQRGVKRKRPLTVSYVTRRSASRKERALATGKLHAEDT